jgi:drug/metabolite transporter (DMT)-like permease
VLSLETPELRDGSDVDTTSSPGGSDLTRGYAIALVSAVVLSTTAIFIRHLTVAYSMPPLVLAFWRDTFVGLTLVLVLGVVRPALLRAGRQHLSYLILYGLTLAIFNTMWTYSVALAGAALATVLVYCSVAFTALLGWWFLKERLDVVKLLAVALCLAGCAAVSGVLGPTSWHISVLGMITGTLSGLCYSIYSLMGRSASQRGLNPWTTVLYTFGSAAVFLLLFNLVPRALWPGVVEGVGDLFWLGDAVTGWAILFALAAGPTVTGFGLYMVCLGYLPASVANLIVTSEPVFTAVMAFFLLGERLSGVQLAGSAMILGAVFFLRFQEGRSARQTA